MPTFVPDPVSWTTHHLHLGLRVTDMVLSNASGFIYLHAERHYLVTNWHVVSGRNPIDGECISDTKGVPDIISTMFREQGQPGNTKRESLALFSDAGMSEPVWYEHPKHGRLVDVVAIPLPERITASYRLFPINAIQFDTEFPTEVADDAFVVGYPFSDLTFAQFPIWKRASIASEPAINVDDLPKLLIDTATRSGLSGSPVVMQRIGLHGMSGPTMSGKEIIGRIRNFIGVYSGRIGKDELKAQLGVVWKAAVIDEIIGGQVPGKAPHEA